MNINWDVFKHESDFVFEKTTGDILNKLKDLGKLKEDENGRYYVDLSGYTAGEHEVAVQIENNDPRIEYVVTKNITIVIK